MHTARSGVCSRYKFETYVRPILSVLADKCDFIRWNRRLEHDNHHETMPPQVTGIVDTMPIVTECGDPLLRRMLCSLTTCCAARA